MSSGMASMDANSIPNQSTDDFPNAIHPTAHLDIRQNAAPHITHALPTIFPIKSEVATLMPASMHVSMPDVTVPANAPTPLGLLSTSGPGHPSASDLIPDFPIGGEPFSMLRIDESHVPVQPPVPPVPSSSRPPSLLPSPIRMPLSSPFTPSLSALERLSGALNTPLSNNIPSPGSELATSSITHTSPDQNTSFNAPSSTEINNPSSEANPHRVVVQDLFYRMNDISRSALESCTKGDPTEAIPKITRLMELMVLTGTLVLEKSSSSLSAGSPPRDEPPYSPNGTPNSSPPIPSTNSTDAQAVAPAFAGDLTNLLEVPGSRKRCASAISVSDDRINKALKMEPEDDRPLEQNSLPSQTMFPPNTTMMETQPTSSFPFVPPNSLSRGPSRPPSPSTLASLQGYPVPISNNSLQAGAFPHIVPVPAAAAPANFEPSAAVSPLSASSSFTARPGNRSSWSELPGAQTQQQRPLQHSYSAGSLSLPMSVGSPFHPLTSIYRSSPVTQISAPAHAGPPVNAALTRNSRNGSLTNNPFTFTYPDALQDAQAPSSSRPLAASGGDKDGSRGGSYDSDDSEEDFLSMPRKKVGVVSRPTTSHGNDIPQETRSEVDRIFFEYLNRICSDLEATDAKGEAIHQTLMAKKMQRLDDSPDFRPFKFRIAAFTHGFLEELARQGYPEEKIPMKKVRNYLWSQPHIVRYNEEGKKVKSKGNHTWNMEAKRLPDGRWQFRVFHRQLTGAPPVVAYVGLPWSWSPRIWHPQGHLPGKDSNMTVAYSSPALPSWLSWKDDVLTGTPPMGAESCDIDMEAKLVQDGHEEVLTHSIRVTVAPSTLEPSFSASSSRRPSAAGEMNMPRRVASDPALPLVNTARPALRPVPQTNQESQVLQVLTSAAQRVAQVAQSQVIASPPSERAGPELQALAKQQHVLTVTAQALDRGGLSEEGGDSPSSMSLAAAAQHVVLSAARQVVADHSAAQVAVGIAPSPLSAAAAAQVTVDEVSAATQSAVAQAVEITGPLSSEVQVLLTASSLLQWQTTSTEAALDTAQLPSESRMHPNEVGAGALTFPSG